MAQAPITLKHQSFLIRENLAEITSRMAKESNSNLETADKSRRRGVTIKEYPIKDDSFEH